MSNLNCRWVGGVERRTCSVGGATGTGGATVTGVVREAAPMTVKAARMGFWGPGGSALVTEFPWERRYDEVRRRCVRPVGRCQRNISFYFYSRRFENSK